MYIFGDWRSETLLFCTSLSRSRCRIFSRSNATAFMRFDRLSVDRSGMAKVSTVAPVATAAKIMINAWASRNEVTKEIMNALP